MNKTKSNIVFISLTVLLLGFFILDLILGSVSISPVKIFNVFIGDETDLAVENIIFNFRLPKAISAVLIGAGLSVSGVMMQTLFRNPLAGPYVMGISSGASLGVAVFVLIGGVGLLSSSLMSYGIAAFAFVGAFLIMLGILFIASKIKDTISLLIIGIMFASISGALVNVLQYFSNAVDVKYFMIWTMGSLSNISWDQLKIMSVIVVLSLIATLFIQKSLNTLGLSENYAKALGVKMSKLRIRVIVLTSLMAGIITAYAGPIVFIGVAIPHLARGLFKTTEHKIIIPASVLLGAVIMLACDIISQLPGSHTVFPINSITSIFGAPIIIWIIIKNRRLHGGF